MAMMGGMWKRQNNGAAFGDEDDYGEVDYDGYHSWWWTPAGTAVRYALFALFLGSLMLFLLGGYTSTQRRLRRGLPPRPAFRWMVRRRDLYARHPHPQTSYPPNPYPYPQRQQHAHYGDPDGQGYGMDGYPAPPPPYQGGEAPPPVYQPPDGGSKVLPDQGVGRTQGEASSSAGVEMPVPAARA